MMPRFMTTVPNVTGPTGVGVFNRPKRRALWLRNPPPHVAAKRYLCAVEPGYLEQLSQPSIVSLRLQGGPMTPEEVAAFKNLAFAEDAVRLRKWDDEAKTPDFVTPNVAHFESYLRETVLKASS